MHVVCADLLCVVCVRLFSTVKTGSSRPMFFKSLCLMSTPEGLASINCQLTKII